MGVTFYFVVAAASETEAIDRSRSVARQIVAESDEFEGIGPVLNPPADADMEKFFDMLIGEVDGFAERYSEWHADPVSEVDDAYLNDVVSMLPSNRMYDLRDDGVEQVRSFNHLAEIRSLDESGLYLVPVRVECAYQPPFEGD